MNVSDLLTLLRSRAAETPDAFALETTQEGHTTYGDLYQKVAGNAAVLAAAIPGRRPRVGIVMPNGADMAVTLLSAACAGAALPFNPAYRASELRSYFQDTRIDMLVVGESDDGDAPAVAAEFDIPVHRVGVGGTLVGLPETPGTPPDVNPDDVALVLLTSGSTGRPKSVPLTHRNVITSSFDVGRSMALSANDRCLSMWEQYHVGGLVDLLMAPLAAGGTVICTPGFDSAAFFSLVESRRPTWFQGVPTTINELVVFARRNHLEPDLSSLRLIRSVAAPLSPQLMAEVENLFEKPVLQTYGMTEAGPLITSTGLTPGSRKPGSVGASCGCEIRVTDDNDAPVGPGVSGPLSVRGPNVFSGYENDPETNAAQFRGGWFFTGDIGYIDEDGDLFITGRIKQLINRGGEKINPQEVDDALQAHPSVSAAASFSVPHRTLGENIAAAVVLRDGETASEQDLRRYLSECLAAFKIPSHIYFMGDLPKNAIGKIDRLAVSVAATTQEKAAEQIVQPRDDLENYLAALWIAELELEQVGIDDDFSEAGGDSFSSVRILAAIDDAVGFAPPETEATNLTTIRGMADWLRDHAPGASPQARADYLDSRVQDARAGDAVDTLDDTLARAAMDMDAARQLLTDSTNPMDFEIACDALLMYPTPSEIQSVLSRHKGLPGPGKQLWLSDPRNMTRIQLRKRKRENGLRQDLSAGDTMMRWRRQALSDHAIHYSDPDVPAASKTLVVGFTGNAMRLMMPSHRILANIDPGHYDLLLLRDPTRGHYGRGVDGLGGDIRTIADSLAEKSKSYRRTVALGVSAGGLAAIVAARHNGWEKAVAIGADAPERHPALNGALGETTASKPEVLLYCAAQNERDHAAALEASQIVPNATMHAIDGMDRHNVLHEMYQSGTLADFLNKVLGSGQESHGEPR